MKKLICVLLCTAIVASMPAALAARAYQMTLTSSNPKVAAVEEGHAGEAIRAIAPGSANITVRAKNGKARATLRVKVVDFNKKLRFYDAEEDAAKTTRKTPAIKDGANELWIAGVLAGMESFVRLGRRVAVHRQRH